MTKEIMKKLKKGDTVYVACKVDAVFIEGGFVQVSTRDCDNGFDAYEDEILDMKLKILEQPEGHVVYGRDGYLYELSISNGKEYEQEPMLDKIKGYINHIRNTGMGKKKSLEFIEKFIDGLKEESEEKV